MSCPVILFKLYLSKLNEKIPALWQKPRVSALHYTDNEWYEGRVVGKDLLERFFKLSLSKSVKLDGEYTNHSIRATVINTLDNEGYEARHIIQLSSHKSEATVKEYATKCSDNKRKEMFETLTNAMQPKEKKQKIEPTATVSVPEQLHPSIEEVKENLPSFDLQPIEFDTIDDDLLSNIILDAEQLITKDNTAKENNKAVELAVNMPAVQQPRIHTQVNTINNNNMPNQMAMQRMPQMYFPHSSVTINYNFGK